VTLFGTILLHAATNLLNDYYDVKSGVDTREVSTAQYRPHPLVEGKLDAGQVRGVSLVLFGLSIAIGIYLAATRGWELLWIGVIGAFGSFTYTAPPLKYKYVALGEVSVFLMWGPLMVEGAYFVQRQSLSISAFWVSLPFGVLVALVLLANNIRDIDHDHRRGIRTLAILLGHRLGLNTYLSLMVLAYAGILVLALTGVLTMWVLIIFASFPLAAKLLRQMKRAVPANADALTAKLDTAFGLLLVVSLIIEGLVG